MSGMEQALERIQRQSSSITLNWAEDNDLWECSIISGGDRYTAFSKDPHRALARAYDAMRGLAVSPDAERT